MIYVLIVLMMGLFIPVQTAANARLRSVVGPAYVSTLISFSVSSIALLAVSVIFGLTVLPTEAHIETAPWWSWLGGIIALLTITCNIYLFKELGQLQAMIIPMFAQRLFSLLIDHFGWFSSRVIPLDAKRLTGAALLIVGVTLVAVIPRLRSQTQNGTSRGGRQVLWQLAAVICGCLMASITAIYALLGGILGSPVQATTVSFLIATVTILLFCTIRGKVQLVGNAFRKEYPWWMWLGGICGATTVFGNAWLVPKIGVGLFAMALLIGQLVLSLLMEHFGWLGAPRKHISWVQIAGILLMIGGVSLIRL